jgi:folate-binding protein YgfZ
LIWRLGATYCTNPMAHHTHQSPLHEHHTRMEAFFLPYGSPEDACEVVETFGDLDMEYASIRKGCVIFDQPHVGTIEARGEDRGTFLNSMLTAKFDDLAPGESRWAFWLNRKGRIDADLRIAQLTDKMLIAADRHLCPATANALNDFIFTEEASVEDVSDRYHRLAIHGPTAVKLLENICTSTDSPLSGLQEHSHIHIDIEGTRILVERQDLTGEIGLELVIPTDQTRMVYDKLLGAAQEHPDLKARPSGWLAINTARIEAGHPMFNLDFGATNLPVESGIIEKRVSFTKGCYLGQEVVARMHARQACNKKVVAIRFEDERVTVENPEIHQPITGSQIFELGKVGETPIGSVTSSTISPMLGAMPICFAMLKSAFIESGTQLSVSAEGEMITGTVQESLRFWSGAQSSL